MELERVAKTSRQLMSGTGSTILPAWRSGSFLLTSELSGPSTVRQEVDRPEEILVNIGVRGSRKSTDR